MSDQQQNIEKVVSEQITEQKVQVTNKEEEAQKNDKNGQFEMELQEKQNLNEIDNKQNGQLSEEEYNQQDVDQQQINRKQSAQKQSINQQSIIAKKKYHDKDAYINKLQNKLNSTKNQLLACTKSFQQATQENKKTKQTLKKVRFDFLSSRQEINTLNTQKSSIEKQKNSLEESNKKLIQQLESYRQAGDINYFKNKIVQLENLLRIQKQELQMKSKMIDQNEQAPSQNSKNEKLTKPQKINILSLIQKYEKESRQTSSKYSELLALNIQLKKQLQELQLDKNQVKIRINQYEAQISNYKQSIISIEEKHKFNEIQLNKKLRSLQDRILNQSEGNFNNSQENNQVEDKRALKSAEQQYGIRVLSPSEERNLILKQFIELEFKHKDLFQQTNLLRQRHYNTLKQIKNISTTHIPKKDYSQLYKRYTKLRKCLQSSLNNQQMLKRQLQNYKNQIIVGNVQDNEQNQIQYRIDNQKRSLVRANENKMLLQQPENQFQKVQNVITKSSQSYKQLYTMKQQLQTKQRLIKMQKLLKQKDEKISIFLNQIKKLSNFVKMYDQQIIFKNNQIQLLRKFNQQSSDKINQIESTYVTKVQSQRLIYQLQEKNILNDVLQIKYMQILKENNQLKSQNHMLNELYNNLKNIYQELLNRQPQTNKNIQNPLLSTSNRLQTLNIESGPCKQCLQRNQKLKQKKLIDYQLQTQGLSDLYYKEIKQLLTILRKFPKKVDTITGELEKQKSTINEVKKRYDQVIDAYGVKYRHLDQEKKGNDQWRAKQRQQIREQFQEIRQLLISERLVNAIRKAKSLIEFYEDTAGQEEGVEQGAEEGEVDERNEEPIEEEKEKENP